MPCGLQHFDPLLQRGEAIGKRGIEIALDACEVDSLEAAKAEEKFLVKRMNRA